VLGYAVGKVSDTDVRRFRTLEPPFQQPGNAHLPPPPPTGMAPLADPSPPAPTAPYPGGMPASLGSQPTHWAGPPTGPGQAGGGYGGPPAPAPQWSVQPPAPRSSSRVWLILAAIVAVLAVVGGTGWFVLGNAFDKEAKSPDASGNISSSDTTTPSEPVDDVTDFDSIEVRFSGLGTRITTGLAACESAATLSAQTERLSCTFDDGELELAEYESTSDMMAARGVVVNFDQDGRYSAQPNGVVFSQKHDNGNAVLYWDNSSSKQAATYTAASPTVKLDSLVSMFRSTGASLTYPTKLEDAGLKQLVEDFTIRHCERIQTYARGELEASRCDTKDKTIYVVRSTTLKQMRIYRRFIEGEARQQDGFVDNWHFTGGDTEGSRARYIDSAGLAAIYWDQTSCTCYAFAYGPDANLVKLTAWWAS
jgi:hypothetical protein